MKRIQSLVTVLAVLIAIGAVCLAWREWAAARRAELALAEAQTRLAAAQAMREEPRRRERPVATAEEVLPPPPPGAEERERPPRAGRRGEFGPDLDNDPEIAPLALKQRQRQIAARYAALFARLNLTPETRAKLEAMLADKQLSRFEAMALARRQGLGREDAQTLAKQADAEADAAVRALIGETAFNQIQEYDRTYQQRQSVTSLSTQLGYAGAALSTAQQEQLISLLADHAVVDAAASAGGFGPQGGPNAGYRAVFGGADSAAEVEAFFAKKAASDTEALSQASSFLTPAQIEAVRQTQQAETDQLRLMALRVDRMRRARAGGGG